MGFAQKMMRKMGHVEGEGLGVSGGGMLEPIAVKLRPQGAGVGVVKEKTAQAKAEEKRAAEKRGEEYVDSSEEERRERRRRKEAIKRRAGDPSAGLEPATERRGRRARQKVRTIAEVEEQDGLQIPDVFKNFIDLTGATPKQIKSSAELATMNPTVSQGNQTQREKAIKHAQLELEALTSTWRELQDRKRYSEIQEAQLNKELESIKSEENELKALSGVIDQISALQVVDHDVHAQIQTILELFDQLGSQTNSTESIKQETAAAALNPLITASLESWSPLQNSTDLVSYLPRIRTLLEEEDNEESLKNKKLNGLPDQTNDLARSRNLDFYESILFSLWLPKVRSAITNEWDAYDPSPMLNLIDEWKEVLPQFIKEIVIDQVVTSKLSERFRSWKPNSTRKPNVKIPPAHIWLFPWLEHLGSYHMDPHSADGLLAEIRRKFRATFGSWNPDKGMIADLDEWLAVSSLKDDLHKDLDIKLLPRLTQYLRDNFEIDPSDQDRTPIDMVLQWSEYFSAEKFSCVFIDAFFPKWFQILYIWLTSDPNYEEVGQWYEWWHSVFPERLNSEPSISSQWEKGLVMMTNAVEHGLESLEKPEDARIIPDSEPEDVKKESTPRVEEEPTTMKDFLEVFCSEEDLLLLPLRKAHPETGHPLLRITASASGGGGVIVYVDGDVVMAQNKRDRNLWEPLDIFQAGSLAELAESR